MFLWILLVLVLLYIFIRSSKIEGFKVDESKKEKKCLICYYGGAFREGNNNTTTSDTDFGYENQENTSKTHAKLKETLNEQGYQTDILINTRQTKYKNRLESWYDPFSLVINKISDKVHGRDYMIQSTIENINKINKYDYNFILFVRIDLFLKPDFFKILNTETDKISFLANNYDPKVCINFTKNNNPKIVDLFILIPKKYYYILDKDFKINHDTWDYLISKYKLTNDDMTFMSDKMFDSNSYIDQNPYYLMSSRNENKNIHTNHTFNMNKKIKNCPKFLENKQEFIKNPTEYYMNKYKSFYTKE